MCVFIVENFDKSKKMFSWLKFLVNLVITNTAAGQQITSNFKIYILIYFQLAPQKIQDLWRPQFLNFGGGPKFHKFEVQKSWVKRDNFTPRRRTTTPRWPTRPPPSPNLHFDFFFQILWMFCYNFYGNYGFSGGGAAAGWWWGNGGFRSGRRGGRHWVKHPKLFEFVVNMVRFWCHIWFCAGGFVQMPGICGDAMPLTQPNSAWSAFRLMSRCRLWIPEFGLIRFLGEVCVFQSIEQSY